MNPTYVFDANSGTTLDRRGLRKSTGKVMVCHASKGNRKKAILGKRDQHGQGGPAVDVL
jgi:hypothetical protein